MLSQVLYVPNAIQINSTVNKSFDTYLYDWKAKKENKCYRN